MIRRFPVIFDAYTSALDRLRDVCVAVLSEEVIFSYPDPAEAPRPTEQYTSITALQDIGIGQPGFHSRALSTTSPLPSTPDVRQIVHQPRETLARVTCFGAQAFDRAILISMMYNSSTARSLWVDVALQCSTQVRDSTRMIGSHWEPVAYVDFRVRYIAQVSADIYSIQSTTCPVTVS